METAGLLIRKIFCAARWWFFSEFASVHRGWRQTFAVKLRWLPCGGKFLKTLEELDQKQAMLLMRAALWLKLWELIFKLLITFLGLGKSWSIQYGGWKSAGLLSKCFRNGYRDIFVHNYSKFTETGWELFLKVFKMADTKWQPYTSLIEYIYRNGVLLQFFEVIVYGFWCQCVLFNMADAISSMQWKFY